MFAHFRAPISWFEIVKRTIAQTREDGCVGLVAQLAFYFFPCAVPSPDLPDCPRRVHSRRPRHRQRVTSLGFKLYVSRLASFEVMDGTIGSVIVLMLWFYVTGFAILTGAEMNAVIDKVLPHHEAAARAASATGQRKKIGPAAEREHHESGRG